MARKQPQQEVIFVRPITEQQQLVIQLLVAGTSAQEAAIQVGVTPPTISRWRHQDAGFIAALNAARREVWEAHQANLRSLHAKAIGVLRDILENSIDEKLQLKAALHVLDRIEPPTGETDPLAVGELLQIEAAEGKSERKKRAAMAEDRDVSYTFGSPKWLAPVQMVDEDTRPDGDTVTL